jgi:hypothetical protein
MRHRYRFSLLALFVIPGMLVESAPAETTRARGVTVEKADVAVERRTFDPRNPPAEILPLENANAVTQSRFGCAASVKYTVVSRRQEGHGRRGDSGGGCTATARIDAVDVKVSLDVTIWLPTNARPKLAAHEEGHRVISERIYHQEAEAAARAEAERLVGKTVTASGADCQAAADAAVKEANEQFCKAYLDATSGWSTRVGNRYDEVTDHGKRSRPDVEEGIRQSFELEPKSKDE